MRDYEQEVKNRIAFIRGMVAGANAEGVIFANSGGKDSALVGILCKMACENTVSLILPCGVERNYKADWQHAMALAKQFNIATRAVDLAEAREVFLRSVGADISLTDSALTNISPRLRMLATYAVAASENRLVAGASNRSEYYLGYFTKWGDGACDFNPIGDLTCTEVFEFLRYLGAPACIIEKPPSAGLYEGQTDEAELGVTYKSVDSYLAAGDVPPADKAIIERHHSATEHKRKLPFIFGVGNGK